MSGCGRLGDRQSDKIAEATTMVAGAVEVPILCTSAGGPKMARDSSSNDLARRLTEALEQGETTFVKTLMEAVKKRGMSRVAREIGTTRSTLYKYDRGQVRQPGFDVLLKMAAVCGVKFKLVSSR